MRLRITLLPLVLFLSTACATPPPPPPESPDLAVLGASVSISGIIGSTSAEYAYFVRLDQEGGLPTTPELLRSNFEKDGYVFLFNAHPGRYAVISAGYFVQTQQSAMTPVGGGFSVGAGLGFQNSINIYLPKTSIEKMAVSVEGGEWAYLGDVVLDRADWEQADQVQRTYSEVLAPGYAEMNFVEKAFGVGRHDPGTVRSLDQSEAGLARFLDTSREIAGEDWAQALRSPVAAGPPER